MVQRNLHLSKLSPYYLFTAIEERKKELLQHAAASQKRSWQSVLSLGTGDTSQPIPQIICSAMEKACRDFATESGYCGYGPDLGLPQLRELIADRHYNKMVDFEEVVISDGAGCDISRLMMMLGSDIRLAVQDPSYPAYIDNAVIMGQTGSCQEDKRQYANVHYLACHAENDFFPDLQKAPACDLIAFCSPNNPTGTAANRQQMKQLVDYAHRHQAIILYDAVYTPFIETADVPKTIYEIDGAKEVAIECQSFSKSAGFTGIRLGWTVVPKELRYRCGHSVLQDWMRISTTAFNGASLISQAGGIAALSDEGRKATKQIIDHYKENARLLRAFFEEEKQQVYGGVDAPYLWLATKKNSWQTFDEIFETCRILTVPGSGFGPAGKHFTRFSAFGSREKIKEAVERLKAWTSRP